MFIHVTACTTQCSAALKRFASSKTRKSKPRPAGAYSSQGMGCTCSRHGEMRNAYKMLVQKHEGKRPTGRRIYSGQDNIKMNLR